MNFQSTCAIVQHGTHTISSRRSLAGVNHGFRSFLTFVLLYSYIVPIALYVTLELQKLCGSLFIGFDVQMYCPFADLPCTAKTSDIIEELGQVEHIFTDKTGTLTQNSMEFRKYAFRPGYLLLITWDTGALLVLITTYFSMAYFSVRSVRCRWRKRQRLPMTFTRPTTTSFSLHWHCATLHNWSNKLLKARPLIRIRPCRQMKKL